MTDEEPNPDAETLKTYEVSSGVDEGEQISLMLWNELVTSEYREQVGAICGEFGGDVAPECLGSMEIYARLAQIIPCDRIIFDIGCAYAFQAYYFRKHKAYIGVDCLAKHNRLKTRNSHHFDQTCGEFLQGKTFPQKSFAICAYVPPWYGENAADLVKQAFNDVFVFYPR